MSSVSTFESRTAKVDFSPEEVYNFATDIRNFRRFLPPESFSDPEFRHDSCSFRVNMLGTVNIQISERAMFDKIIFSGNALRDNNFSLTINLHETEKKHSEIKLTLSAEMNPVLKMVATEPVNKFLETLVTEMEKFRGWNDITEQSRPL